MNFVNLLKAIHKNNDEVSERGKIKAKLYGVSSQLDALAERLSMLPKTVSATPTLKQMEKLELIKKDLQEGLLKIKDFNEQELKIKKPEKNRVFLSGLNSSANFGSHSLTIGAPRGCARGKIFRWNILKWSMEFA